MHCRACDKQLGDHEGHWREDIGDHEDMCRNCLRIARVSSFGQFDEADESFQIITEVHEIMKENGEWAHR